MARCRHSAVKNMRDAGAVSRVPGSIAPNIAPSRVEPVISPVLDSWLRSKEPIVKVYVGENVRNVAIVGHGHAGKTSLISAMLFTAGATQRLGRVDDGSSTTDYDDEEIARKMSVSAGLAYAEWGNTKINFIDTPGFNMFVHEAKLVLPVVDAAVVVVDGVAGVEVVTERVWNYCEEYKTPRVIVASRMDRERADAERVLASLTRAFGRAVVPLELPI